MAFIQVAQHQQQVEKLSLNFAQIVISNMNNTNESAPTKRKKNKNKNCRITAIKMSNRSKSRSKDKQSAQIERVEEWLQHRSAHYAWWRKSDPDGTQFDRQCCPKDPVKDSNGIKTRPKQQRCVLWIEFAGRPVNRIGQSAISVAGRRKHSIRIDQQPLGGATAVVFAADLHVGEKFGLVSRRQPGFTLSLTFFIDGVRHARLSGCCENGRNIHIPTRIGGPTGAFVLCAVQGGQQCNTCENSTTLFNRELFTIRPKCQKSLRISQELSSRDPHSKVASDQKSEPVAQETTGQDSADEVADTADCCP